MKHSLTYYLTLFIIKLKGLKNDFSKDPIDFKKVRKEDVHLPKTRLFKDYDLRRFKIKNSLITELKQKEPSQKLLIFIHGGAFISGPSKHHWDVIKEILEQSNQNIWMCDYPKAPENKIQAISDNMDAIYSAALEIYPSKTITLIGDSVGGTLVAALTQRLIKKGIDLPQQIILVSPVMDATMSNPEIDEIDKTDPMLSKVGVKSAKKMCAEHADLNHEMISPINGSFQNFPKTMLFLATNDITYPDQKLVVQKLKEASVNIEILVGENMPHIWPFLPVMKEAKTALKVILDNLKAS